MANEHAVLEAVCCEDIRSGEMPVGDFNAVGVYDVGLPVKDVGVGVLRNCISGNLERVRIMERVSGVKEDYKFTFCEA